MAKLGADKPSTGSQADQRAPAHPPRECGLRPGAGEVGSDLRVAVGGLGVLATQRSRCRLRVGLKHTGQVAQVGSERPPGRRGKRALAFGDEALDHRGVQKHLPLELEAHGFAEGRELGGREE